MFDYETYWHGREFPYDNLNLIWREEISEIVGNDSVLELGCGAGRMAPCFNPDKYLGIDINSRDIDYARVNHPEYKFEVADLVKYDIGDYDWVFTWTTLELVPPELMEGIAKKLKGKKLLFCEPAHKSFVPNVDYCFDHDYKKIFNVDEVGPIDGIIYLHVGGVK